MQGASASTRGHVSIAMTGRGTRRLAWREVPGHPRLVGSHAPCKRHISLRDPRTGITFQNNPSLRGYPGKAFARMPATSTPGSDQDYPEHGPNRDFACRYPALTQTNDLGNAPSRLKRDLHVSRGESCRFLVTSLRPRYFPSMHQRGWTRLAADQAGDAPRTGGLLCRPSRPGPALAATTASGRRGRDDLCCFHHCSPTSFSRATATSCMRPLLAAAYTVLLPTDMFESQESSGQTRRRIRFMIQPLAREDAVLPDTAPGRARGAQPTASGSQSRTAYRHHTCRLRIAHGQR